MTQKDFIKYLMIYSMFLNSVAFAQQPQVQDAIRKLDNAFEKAFSYELSPGFAIGVVVGDSVIYQRGIGYANLANKTQVDENTCFYIASTTKSLTALTVLALVKEDRISVDDPLSKYLPDVVLQPPLNADSITVRELLAHTHGIDGRGPVVLRTAYTGQYEKGELAKLLKYHGAEKEPGVFHYGNIGYNILGMIIEAVTGKNWKSVVDEYVLKPAGMNSTTGNVSTVASNHLALPYNTTETGYRELYLAKSDANMHAAGGHFSTVHDMSRFLIALINDGKIGDKQVFSKELIKSSRQLLIGQDRKFWDYNRFAWSPGWDISDFKSDTVYSRFGSFNGYFSYLAFLPAYKIGLVAYTNELDLGAKLIKLTTSYAIELLRGRKGADSLFAQNVSELPREKSEYFKDLEAERQKRAERQKTSLPFPLESYTGKFVSDVLGTMVWRYENDQLNVAMGVAQCKAEIYDAGQNALRVELLGGGSVVRFEFVDGKASTIKFLGQQFTRVE